jgi:hypothetical protein
MVVESFPQLRLPIGQILPPAREGDYENDNWQTQYLNHRRRRREAERTGILHIPKVFSLVMVKVCTGVLRFSQQCNLRLPSSGI